MPKLFAQDFSYWTANQNRKVVIFLDSYDILKNKGRKTKEHPEPDWWIKGEDEFALGGAIQGLLLSIPNVVWVLSGRNELKFDGYLGEKIHQKEIQPLNNIYSLQFLQSRGITNNDELCAKITKLTQGYPLYLELCSQQYRMPKKKDKYHEPEISDFGAENEEFSSRIGKIVLNLIECVDDTGIREMIKYLCAIGTWTDEVAGKIVPLLNETAYNIIKDFSFIRTREAEEDNLNETLYRFDSIVKDILIVKYKRENKFVVGKTIENANAYFSDMFKNVKFDIWREDDDKIVERNLNLSLKLWATIIVKLNDSAERLMQIYETYFDKLTDSRRFRNTADEVVNQFFNKVKIIAKPNKAPYAYFEYVLGIVKFNQNRDKEALELAESAYNKFNKLYGEENKYTIGVMHLLTNVYIGRGDQLKAIKIQKKIVEVSKIIFRESYEIIISYMYDLSLMYRREKQFSDEANILQQLLNILKEHYSPDNMKIVNQIATILNFIARAYEHDNDCEKALLIRKEYVEFFEKDFNDDNYLLEGLENLANALQVCKNYKEETIVRQRILNFYEKLNVLNDKEYIECYSEYLENTANFYNELGQEKEASQQDERIIKIRRQMLIEREAEFNENDDKSIELLIEALEDLIFVIDSEDEKLLLRRRIVSLQSRIIEIKQKGYDSLKKKYDKDSEEVIRAIQDLTDTCRKLKNKERELYARKQPIEIYKIIKDDDHGDTFREMEEVSDLLENMNRYKEAIKIQEDIVEMARQNRGDNSKEALRALDNLAKTYETLGQLEDALKIRKQIIKELKKSLNEFIEKYGTEKHFSVCCLMSHIASNLKNIKCFAEEVK